MAQITWKNVASTTSSGGATLMEGARQGLSDSFATLQGIMDKQQETQQFNTLQMRENNTAEFLDTLHNYRTPEELAAARESGVFQEMRDQYGASVDRDAVRKALDERAGTLRTRVSERQEHEDTQINRDLRDEVQELRARALGGENVTQEALALGYRDEGQMLSETFGDYRQGMGEQRAEAGERRAQADFGYRQGERARLASERERLAGLNASVLDTIRGQQNLRQAEQSTLVGLADEHNVPVAEDGRILWDEASSADDVAAFRQSLEAQGLTDSVSDTEATLGTLNGLIGSGQIQSVEELNLVQEMMGQGLGAFRELSPADKADAQAKQASVEARYDRELEILNEDFDRAKSTNIFLEGVDPTSDRMEAAQKVLGDVEIEAFLEDSNTNDVLDVIDRVSMRGVEVGNSGEFQRLDPAVVASGIKRAQGEWFGTAEKMEEYLTRFVNQNADQILAAERELADNREKTSNIQRQKLQAAAAIPAQYLRDSGVPMTTAGSVYEQAQYFEQRLRRAEEEANQ